MAHRFVNKGFKNCDVYQYCRALAQIQESGIQHNGLAAYCCTFMFLYRKTIKADFKDEMYQNPGYQCFRAAITISDIVFSFDALRKLVVLKDKTCGDVIENLESSIEKIISEIPPLNLEEEELKRIDDAMEILAKAQLFDKLRLCLANGCSNEMFHDILNALLPTKTNE